MNTCRLMFATWVVGTQEGRTVIWRNNTCDKRQYSSRSGWLFLCMHALLVIFVKDLPPRTLRTPRTSTATPVVPKSRSDKIVMNQVCSGNPRGPPNEPLGAPWPSPVVPKSRSDIIVVLQICAGNPQDPPGTPQ